MTNLPVGFGPFLLDVARVPRLSPVLERLFREDGMKPRGVIHVGGHYGQEIETYMACGLDPIVLVEANPAVLERLERHVSFWTDWFRVFDARYGMVGGPRILTVHAAASDRCGHAAFYVTEHDPQSSILPPDDPAIRMRGTIEVESATLDQILADQNIPVASMGMLTMDAQGAEAMILRGGQELLKHLDIILTEVNYVSRYKRDAKPEEIEDIVASAGFEEVFRTEPLPGYEVVDVLYKRREPASRTSISR